MKEDRIDAIYKIKCIHVLIGESGRVLGDRLKERKAACKYANFDESPVVEHQNSWDDVIQHRIL